MGFSMVDVKRRLFELNRDSVNTVALRRDWLGHAATRCDVARRQP